MEPPNTSPQTIEIYPSCLKEFYFNNPGTNYGNKSTKPGHTCILFRVSSYNSSKEQRECLVWQGRLVNSFRAAGKNVRLDFRFSWRHLKIYSKDHKVYNHGSHCHVCPTRVSLLVGGAQVAQCFLLCSEVTIDTRL